MASVFCKIQPPGGCMSGSYEVGETYIHKSIQCRRTFLECFVMHSFGVPGTRYFHINAYNPQYFNNGVVVTDKMKVLKALTEEEVLEELKTDPNMLNLLLENWQLLKKIPHEMAVCSSKLYEDFFKKSKDKSGCSFVPYTVMDSAYMSSAVVEHSAINLKYVNRKHISQDMCDRCVSHNAWSLAFVPDHFKHEAMCLEAVKKHVTCFNYVPESLITQDMVDLVKSNHDCYAHIPLKFKTLEFVFENLKSGGFISCEDFRPYLNQMSHQLCLELVNINGVFLKLLPDHMRVSDVCDRAFKINPKCLEYIPKIHWNGGMVTKCVDLYPYYFTIIPDEWKTESMCLYVVQKYGRNIRYVPDRFMTQAVIRAALENDELEVTRILPKKHLIELNLN
jgi:hypothetical protein